ncbi:MAG TPA: hypothetical protein VFS20_07010 [Longimicrobium sp.]|nr:hypothetical protein [Longimicrobium sp.]
MDPRASLTPAPARCRRGTTFLEVLVCLAVLGLVVTGFVRHLGGASATRARLAEREKAEGAARGVRALLSAEDPWGAPESRTLLLGADGAPPGVGEDTYEARIDGSTVCDAAAPRDNALAAAPGSCPGGARAVRRWTVVLSYTSRYSADGRDSITTTLDMDAASPPGGAAGALLK